MTHVERERLDRWRGILIAAGLSPSEILRVLCAVARDLGNLEARKEAA